MYLYPPTSLVYYFSRFYLFVIYNPPTTLHHYILSQISFLFNLFNLFTQSHFNTVQGLPIWLLGQELKLLLPLR